MSDGLAGRLTPLSRAAWLLAGLLGLLWLGMEESPSRGPIAVAALASLAAGLTVLRRWRRQGGLASLDPRWTWLVQSTVCGIAAGALMGPLAALLMLLGVPFHGHPIPDSPSSDLAGVLIRTPAWMLVGLCLGGALGLAGAAADRGEAQPPGYNRDR